MPEKIITHPQNNVYAREWVRIYEPERNCDTCKHSNLPPPEMRSVCTSRIPECKKGYYRFTGKTPEGLATVESLCNADNGYSLWENKEC